jgi:putative peptidoglycan lipid II flippase
VLVPAFYALGDTKTPVRASFLSVAVNLSGNLLLMQWLGHVGLALSTSLTMLFNFAQLSWAMRQKLGRFEGRRLLSTVARTAAASAAMAALLRGFVLATTDTWRGSFGGAALVVGGGLVAGALATWLLYRAFRVAELSDLEGAVAAMGRRVGIGRRR